MAKPEPEQNDIYIFGREYDVWRNGIYLGTATLIDSEDIGPAFVTISISGTGTLLHEVIIPTKYKLI